MPKNKRPGQQVIGRRHDFRIVHDRILVVCEGQKTEPLYFGGIRKEHRLSSSLVVICDCSGKTAPLQIVEAAAELFRKGNPHEGIEAKCFDRIYAVFDRDQHDSYRQALERAEALNNKMENDEGNAVPFEAVPSNPCFELWLLLHYEDVTSLQPCGDVVKKLRKHYEDFQKNDPDSYERTKDNLSEALKNARRLEKTSSPLSEKKPYTAVHKLVDALRTLRK